MDNVSETEQTSFTYLMGKTRNWYALLIVVLSVLIILLGYAFYCVMEIPSINLEKKMVGLSALAILMGLIGYSIYHINKYNLVKFDKIIINRSGIKFLSDMGERKRGRIKKHEVTRIHLTKFHHISYPRPDEDGHYELARATHSCYFDMDIFSSRNKQYMLRHLFWTSTNAYLVKEFYNLVEFLKKYYLETKLIVDSNDSEFKPSRNSD